MGSAARWKPSADHPLLVPADDFNQHLVRDDIERTEPTETPAVRSVTEARIRTSSDHNGFMFNWAAGDRRMLVASGRGVGLSFGPVADRDRPLGSWSWWTRSHLLNPIRPPRASCTLRLESSADRAIVPKQSNRAARSGVGRGTG
jgi:hypothetical protein